MPATVISSDPAPTVAVAESSQPVSETEVEFAKCECCGLTEECTPGYIDGVRRRHQGRWICGLCAEAVKDEMVRSGRLISTAEALKRHMNFFQDFRSAGDGPPSDPTVHLIAAVRQLLRRTLESPRGLRPTKCSLRPRRVALPSSLVDEKNKIF